MEGLTLEVSQIAYADAAALNLGVGRSQEVRCSSHSNNCSQKKRTVTRSPSRRACTNSGKSSSLRTVVSVCRGSLVVNFRNGCGCHFSPPWHADYQPGP